MPKKQPYVRAIALANLPEFVAKHGGDPKRLISKVGLDFSHIGKQGTFLSWSKACNLLELCAETINEPQFGIKWADEISEDFPNTGPMVLITALVSNVRQFINIAIEYHKSHCNGLSYELTEDEVLKEASYFIHLHPQTPACRQYAEHIAAVIVRMSQRYLFDIKFKEIHFQHSPLCPLEFYETKFNCKVIFNSNHFKIIGKTSDLDKPFNGPLANTPLNGSLAFLQPVLKRYLDRRLIKVRHSETPITNTIEEILPSVLGAKKSDIDSLATILGISTKKLQRLLKTEGHNFSAIRDKTRQNMTKRFFSESDIPIADIARALDYKSPEAFNTACKRWVGQPPREYRKTLKTK